MDNPPTTVEYPALNRLDLTDQAYNILRDRILKRQMQPGEKISVETVASGLGVSRTPVVNALKLLEGDGLVEIRPRRGTFVTEVTKRDVAELFEIRLLIELYAAEELFRKNKVQSLLHGFAPYLDRMQAAISEDDYVDYEAFISGDRDLHTLIVEQLGNQRLFTIYNELNIHMRIARAHYSDTVENALQAQVEHQAMVTALEAEDLEALKSALRAHIVNVKDRMIELIEDLGGKL